MRRIIDELNGLNKLEVVIGVHSGSTNDKGQDLAGIAAANEFGVPSRKVPSRPFMATTFAKKNSAAQDLILQTLRNVASGKLKPYAALGRFGQRYQEWMVSTIASWTTPPNAPRTIAKKGRDEPLRDTYSMMKSVRWVIRPFSGNQ